MKGLEALEEIGTTLMFINKNTLESKPLKEVMPNYYNIIEKSLKALEILKRNVKVIIDYGGKYTISMALVFFIDNKKTIYIVDEVIKEQNPEHFKELELLKEVIE